MYKILNLNSFDGFGGAGMTGPDPMGLIGGIATGIMLVFLVIGIGIYVYLSLAYSKIGKKTGITNPGIAWAPYFGPIVTIFETAKAHWWPFAMIGIGFSTTYLLMFASMMSFNLGMVMFYSVLIVLLFLTFGVMTVIWHWKTYEVIGKPGWWILPPVIGFALGYGIIFLGALSLSGILALLGMGIVLLSPIVHLVFVGIAAWSKN